MFQQLGLIGCGLMGGSFALALKRAGLVQRVVGYSPSGASTRRALELGVIDQVADTPALAALGADLVLVAVPVAATETTLRAIRDALGTATLVMDVGSTKSDVVAAAERALQEKIACFVGAHPIAGKEVSGVAHADPALYTGRQVILTPTGQTAAVQLEKATQLWTALGCRVQPMSPQAHDAAYAAVSHLPHLLAFAFMNSLCAQEQGAAYQALAGPGFRDFSRIAASEPGMWRDILLANAEELLYQSKQFQHHLQMLEAAIETGDATALQSLINQASQARARWSLDHAKQAK